MSTDFREYSAAFHDHQNDLMHYGVKGMKWDPSKKKKKLISEVADKEGIDAVRRDAKYEKQMSKFSSKQLNTILSDRDRFHFDRVVQHPDGSRTMISDARDAARKVLLDRDDGKAKEPTNPYKPKKRTGLQKAATSVARKEEKKRNKKLINARKAERAYRRGGH